MTLAIPGVPPDTHQIQLTDQQTGQPVGKSLWVRIRATHDGGPAAENVEIVVTRLWNVTDGGTEEDTGFLPLSLTWSHHPPPANSTTRIPKRLFRHCDFGVFTPASGKTWLQITTLVQPNPVGQAWLSERPWAWPLPV